MQEFLHDEFGRVLKSTAPGFQPFGFAGGLYDHNTGLVQFGARWYDPQIGRWISKDPIGFAGADTNLYAYVGGNPVNYMDPTGLYWFRQDWQEAGTVGRSGSRIVPPKGTISQFIEKYIPAGYTFGKLHDDYLDVASEEGLSDWMMNIPSMPSMYAGAVFTEVFRTLGIYD